MVFSGRPPLPWLLCKLKPVHGRAYQNIYIYNNTHTHMHAHTHIYIHTQTDRLTHTLTHTHIYIYIYLVEPVLKWPPKRLDEVPLYIGLTLETIY